MKRRTRDPAFLAAFILTTFAFFLNLIAFVTPFWLASIPSEHHQFVRIGLWVACFNGYMHPQDMVYKAYYGCWYIYYKEFDRIRTWLNPDWFYACQVMSTIGFIGHIFALIVVACQGCRMLSRRSKKSTLTAIVCHFLTGCCFVITLIAVGVQSNDRRWMPNPEKNRLSWSYAFAVLSLACTLGSFLALCYIYLRPPPSEEAGPNHMKYREAMQHPGPYDPRARHYPQYVEDAPPYPQYDDSAI